MATTRPNIPNPMKRAIRRRCGFGCVICGYPLYEYHHIIPYSESKEHIQDEITLLCDKHHKEATNGLLIQENIIKADKLPHNVRQGISSPYNLRFEGSKCEISIGGNRFPSRRNVDGAYVVIPIAVDDIDLLAFHCDGNGNLFLHATIFDELNRCCLKIIDNQVAYRADSWDITFEGKSLTIREASRKVLLKLVFNPPNAISIPRGRLLCNGVEMLIRKNHVFLVNTQNLNKNVTFEGSVGILIGRNDRNLISIIGMQDVVPRYLLSRTDVEKIERESLKRIK